MKNGLRYLGCLMLAGLLASCGAETKQPSDGPTGGSGGTSSEPMTGGMGPTGGTAAMPAPTRPTGPCTNECLPGTPARCNNSGIETCVDANFDGCYEWSQPVPCADGLSCSNGACSAECQDECQEGLRDCGMVGVRICAKDHDGDPCTDWGPEEACPEGEFCSGGLCGTECADECEALGQPQCDPSDAKKFRLCGQLDNDPCLELGEPIDCGEGETCSNNRCAAADSCTDECTEGQVTCNAERTALQTCERRDADMCLTYSNIMPCGDAEKCCAGACVGADQACNECELDDRRCEADGYQVCEADAEGNLAWSNVRSCDGRACAFGDCVMGSVDECNNEGERQCVPGDARAYRVCGQFDADPERDLSAIQQCAENEVCGPAGACIPANECQNLCAADEADRCEGNTVVTCSQLAGTDCRGWDVKERCAPGQMCVGGVCGEAGPNCNHQCMANMLMGTMCAENGRELLSCEEINGCRVLNSSDCAADEVCPVDGNSCQPSVPADNVGMVTFVRPAVGAVVSGENVGVRVRGEDPDGPLTIMVEAAGVPLMDQPQPIGNGEFFNVIWDTTERDNDAARWSGATLLRATLTDSQGRTTEATRNVVVDNGGPAIRIASPAVGEVIGARFVFSAEISDPTGIQSYEMYVGGERVLENRGVPAGITQLPIPADADVDERTRRMNNPRITINPNSPLFGDGMQTLRVVATDNDGNTEEASIVVEFSNELLVGVTSPVLDDGEFPEISRPFEWEVTASSPAGITGVTFLVDGQEIATDRDGPVYSATIDPLVFNGMPSDTCGDEFEHNLSIVVTDGNGEQFIGSWCAVWDSTPPTIQMTNPAIELDGTAGLITRDADGDRFGIEMVLEDGDDQPNVEVLINDAVIGQQNMPPYQVSLDGDPLLANSETHDQEINLLVRATDYLGNVGTIAPNVRVSRADWAIAINDHDAPLAIQGKTSVAFGLWDATDNQGRIIALGDAGNGGAIWDVKSPTLRPGLRPVEGFFYGNTNAVGVRVEINGNGSGFVHIDEGGNAWEILDEGTVASDSDVRRSILEGPASSTYIAFSEPSAVRRYDANGLVIWSNEFNGAAAEISLPGAEAVQMNTLEGGDLILHTKTPIPVNQCPVGDDGMQDPNGCGFIHRIHRISAAGAEVWSHEVAAPIQREVHVKGDYIVYARSEDLGINNVNMMPETRLHLERLNANTGTPEWNNARPLPLNVNEQWSGFRGDGHFLFLGRNLHNDNTHVFSINMEDGALAFATATPDNGFTVPGFVLEDVSILNTGDGEVAVTAARSNQGPAPVGQHQGEIFRLAPQGQRLASYQTALTRIVPAPDGDGNLTLTESVNGMASLEGTIAANLNIGMTGEERIILLQSNTMTERWSFPLPAGATADGLSRPSSTWVDAKVRLTSGDGAVYPIGTAANPDGAGEIAQLAWRIQREGFEVSQLLSRPSALYVALVNRDTDRLELMRIPRNQ